MKKVKANVAIEELSKEQRIKFNKWLTSKRLFINLTLEDGRVFSARKETYDLEK